MSNPDRELGDPGRAHVLHWLWTIVAWITVFVGMTLIAGLVSGVSSIDLLELSQHGEPISGMVTSLRPQEHNSCDFSYEMAGRVFTGTVSRCASDRRVGDTLPVLVLAGRPSVATADTSPRRTLIERILVTATVATGIAMFGSRALVGRRGMSPR